MTPSTLDTSPRPRSTHPLVAGLRGLWTLPTNLFGHAVGALVSFSTGRPVGGPAARGRLYVIRMPLVEKVKGITLGHAILLSPDFAEGTFGRLVLAHELAHTRQHDLLGPLYLPLHAVAQLISAVIWPFARVEGSDPVHAHNPLEQRWLFLGHDAIRGLMNGERMAPDERDRWLDALGV